MAKKQGGRQILPKLLADENQIWVLCGAGSDHGTGVHAVDANNQQRYSTDGSEHSWPRPG